MLQLKLLKSQTFPDSSVLGSDFVLKIGGEIQQQLGICLVSKVFSFLMSLESGF